MLSLNYFVPSVDVGCDLWPLAARRLTEIRLEGLVHSISSHHFSGVGISIISPQTVKLRLMHLQLPWAMAFFSLEPNPLATVAQFWRAYFGLERKQTETNCGPVTECLVVVCKQISKRRNRSSQWRWDQLTILRRESKGMRYKAYMDAC